jgi:hypothetical protein
MKRLLVGRWAATMADMPPDQRANMLDQLPEDDRLIVQRILDTNAITRCMSLQHRLSVMLRLLCMSSCHTQLCIAMVTASKQLACLYNSQQRRAVEEASARVHDMSPRRGVASPHQPGSSGGNSSTAGSAVSSPRQPPPRRGASSEEGAGIASRLSRPGRPPPPAYDDIVQVTCCSGCRSFVVL